MMTTSPCFAQIVAAGLIAATSTVGWLAACAPAGLGQNVAHTTEKWYSCTVPVDALVLDIEFIDESHGFSVGGTTERGPSLVLRTDDCGETWHVVSTTFNGRLYDVEFPTSTRGYAAGYGVLLRSTDGGATWQELPMLADRWLAAITFPSADVGFVAGGHGSEPILWQTRDGGDTWRSIADRLPADGRDSLRALHFINELHGYVLGDGGYLCETRDGGEHWTRLDAGSTAWLRAMFVTEQGFWIATSQGLLLHNDDDDYALQETVGKRKLNDVLFLNDRHGLCTDFAGEVLETRDGGKHWTTSLTIDGTPTILALCGDKWIVLGSDAGIWRRPITSVP